ncbi:hypothetical protein [Candidatus Thiothrix anitrata]|jgi:hypothetical protein|uniref:Low-complexity protein n=1 Tax=Candidatus Thiothrix anitrata TaxID=2823902 RepID=A0ABX7X506_9GAMM|nr:hypothetical protein [Candidatus Thiothrix anitrata]QTR50964.1 hypothetical protein J8380_05210 [Candidatus Thiothrix anitrata]
MKSNKLSLALSLGTIILAGSALTACGTSPFSAKSADTTTTAKSTNGSCGAKKDGSCGAKKDGSCGAKKDGSCGAKKEGSCGAKKDGSCGTKK